MTAEITTLPSGLRVVTDRMPHLETASISVFVGAGSRYEKLDEQGLSHLLEHMAFKGTRRRSARQIAEEIEMAGGDLNAATGAEHTAYHAHVLAGDIPLAIDLLADILTESMYDSVELAREKSVILEEIRAAEDTPDELVFDMLNAAAFPDQAIGRPVLGTPEHVLGFGREAIGSYLDAHYHPRAIVISAAGAVDHALICSEAVKRFVKLPEAHHCAGAPPAFYRGGDKRLKRSFEQIHIAIGFEGCAYTHEDFYAMQLFAIAAGGGMSSRLFQEVREARGLAYSVHAFHCGYSDTGLFGCYAATDPKNASELLPVAIECLGQAALDLGDAEVQRAKAQMKVSLLAALESPAARCDQIARQLMVFGRVFTREEMIAAIDGLDVARIRAAGARALRTPPTLAAVGPAAARILGPDRIAARLSGL
ncbi:MAG TPA: pitrilysin family protein [Methylocella sp.]|nr:pitrilysin family protein [Methylocella sp.]